MLKKIKYPETLEYSSDGKHLPIEFYMLTVPECKKIDLKLGYFSSNAIRTLAYGFAQFIHHGGQLRIITNHFLSAKDKRLISNDDDENSLVEEERIEYVIENDVEDSLSRPCQTSLSCCPKSNNVDYSHRSIFIKLRQNSHWFLPQKQVHYPGSLRQFTPGN